MPCSLLAHGLTSHCLVVGRVAAGLVIDAEGTVVLFIHSWLMQVGYF